MDAAVKTGASEQGFDILCVHEEVRIGRPALSGSELDGESIAPRRYRPFEHFHFLIADVVKDITCKYRVEDRFCRRESQQCGVNKAHRGAMDVSGSDLRLANEMLARIDANVRLRNGSNVPGVDTRVAANLENPSAGKMRQEMFLE